MQQFVKKGGTRVPPECQKCALFKRDQLSNIIIIPISVVLVIEAVCIAHHHGQRRVLHPYRLNKTKNGASPIVAQWSRVRKALVKLAKKRAWWGVLNRTRVVCARCVCMRARCIIFAALARAPTTRFDLARSLPNWGETIKAAINQQDKPLNKTNTWIANTTD